MSTTELEKSKREYLRKEIVQLWNEKGVSNPKPNKRYSMEIKSLPIIIEKIRSDIDAIGNPNIIGNVWQIAVIGLYVQADNHAWNEFCNKYNLKYFNLTDRYNIQIERFNRINSELSELKDWKRKFDSHIEVIIKHFNAHGATLVA